MNYSVSVCRRRAGECKENTSSYTVDGNKKQINAIKILQVEWEQRQVQHIKTVEEKSAQKKFREKNAIQPKNEQNAMLWMRISYMRSRSPLSHSLNIAK